MIHSYRDGRYTRARWVWRPVLEDAALALLWAFWWIRRAALRCWPLWHASAVYRRRALWYLGSAILLGIWGGLAARFFWWAVSWGQGSP